MISIIYDILQLLHVISFVFMSIPLFNLIVVNERAQMGPGFLFPVDRYMENIIAKGAPRCFVFQATVLVTGLLLLVYGSLGIEALWTNGAISAKFILLLVLVALLSTVHLILQPRIEALIAQLDPEQPLPEEIASRLKPLRVRRKKMAAVCLFLVLTIIILGLQIYTPFAPGLTLVLIATAALFAWRAYSSRLSYGWV